MEICAQSIRRKLREYLWVVWSLQGTGIRLCARHTISGANEHCVCLNENDSIRLCAERTGVVCCSGICRSIPSNSFPIINAWICEMYGIGQREYKNSIWSVFAHTHTHIFHGATGSTDFFRSLSFWVAFAERMGICDLANSLARNACECSGSSETKKKRIACMM